ncbi:general transcription factor II-I repeat domain-containing protein 2A-like [Prorops nasuta]|uniref:general transcription factor II-I repeat domain-containing protein 2A-like n=1 Tax=Prorops nasuta TaxID=863751 RepID=UPI0034CEA929
MFVRIVQDDFSYTEELLFFFPLHDTTTGADIFSAVENTFEKFNINFSKFSCNVTDGAPSMLGTRIGLARQLFQRHIKVPLIHCIIHQEALCGNAIKITAAMKMVTKIINFIKGGYISLTHRQFKLFLSEHDSLYKDIPLYSDNEIMMFLQSIAMTSAMYNEFKSFLEDIDSLLSHIDSFIAKLNMLMHNLIHNSFYHFPAYLQALRKDLILYENVFFVPIEEQNVTLREKLCDLQNGISLHYLKNKFQNSLEIKTSPKEKYPFLRSFVLRIFSMFRSTYLCECSFSKMEQIKNDLRSSMNDSTLTALMRTYLTNIEIDTSSLWIRPIGNTTYKKNASLIVPPGIACAAPGYVLRAQLRPATARPRDLVEGIELGNQPKVILKLTNHIKNSAYHRIIGKVKLPVFFSSLRQCQVQTVIIAEVKPCKTNQRLQQNLTGLRLI